MASVGNSCLSSVFTAPLEKDVFLKKMQKSSCNCLMGSNNSFKLSKVYCGLPESGIEKKPKSSTASNSTKVVEDYNTAMKRMMRNPYEYHHDLARKNGTMDLILPQKPEDIDHLREVENVAYILNLQQDKDVEYWGIDLQWIINRCKEVGIRHMRRPEKDFDPDSLRNGLPKAVSSLEWAISEGKGKVYVHCTAGLGRAPAVAIAYMYWFLGMNLNAAYDALTSKRPCGPNKRAIQGATYDLAKNDPWKEPFENLPEYAFEDMADWERKLIQDRVISLRGT
ncbi:hypothetical protein ACLB2K_074877 [Fragaria x ananassa]